MKMSRFELSVITAVLNSPGGGSTIQELRVIKKTLAQLVGLETPDPVRPEAPKPPEGAKEMTEEQKKSWMEEAKAYSEKLKAKAEELLEVEFPADSLNTIKSKFSTFRGFHSDEMSRAKILALSDKLGV